MINPDHPYCDLSVSIAEDENRFYVSAYPNPISTSCTVEYKLNTVSSIQFKVYSVQGKEVYYYQETKGSGTHIISWSPANLPAGLYYAVLRSEEGVSVVKMVKQ